LTGKENILVLVPAYNESAVVGHVVRAVRRLLPDAEVLVVNDGSVDDTATEAASAGATVLSLPCNMGYGVALQSGFKYALRTGARFVALIDADGQHDPEYLRPVLEPVVSGECDMVIGSRFLGEGNYRPSFFRRVGSVLFATVASILINKRITDSTSGYQAFGPAAIKFNASELFPTDYPDADLIVMMHRSGMRLKEVPVRMHEDRSGVSMHDSAIGSFYYVFRMFLSLAVILMRKTK
jgi:glycosyltransferase involved in cell wall biosynthesis